MVQFNGKYELIKNENFREYLIALAISEEHAKIADEASSVVLEVTVDGDKVSLKSSSNIKNSSSELIVGKAVEEPLPLGYSLQSTTSIEGDKIIVSSVSPKGKGTRTYNFTDAGLTVVFETEDSKIPIAKRIYKRL